MFVVATPGAPDAEQEARREDRGALLEQRGEIGPFIEPLGELIDDGRGDLVIPQSARPLDVRRQPHG
ncbi:MAG: hypothetical protein R3F43_03060 [bacterium]